MVNPENRTNKIRLLIRTCQRLAKINRVDPEARKSDVKYYEMLATYYSRVLQAQEEGDFLAAHTVFFPTEILYAMDIVPMHTELTTWLMALFLGEQAELLAAGAELGLVPEICSPHRGLAGAFALGALPKPDVVLWSNLICDNTAKSGELVMDLNDCPGFFLDHPFQDTQNEATYLVKELYSMIDFLEQESGHRMDWDKLARIVAQMNRQMGLFRDINELRKAVPSPFHTQGFLEILSADYLFPGQPESIDYLETVRQELANMVEAGKGAVPSEHFRLMTLFVPPMYMMGFLDKLAQEHGATSVVEPLFTRWTDGYLDPAKPLESVAKKADLIPERRTMYGPLDQNLLKDITDCVEQYKVDGAIYWAFMGCRHTCATIKIFKDLLNQLDIPMLTVDCDIVDPTINSREEIREELEQFFELLQTRRRQMPSVKPTDRKVVGIDSGNLTTNAVILDSNGTIFSSSVLTGDDTETSAKTVLEEVLSKAGMNSSDEWCAVATGIGATSIAFSERQKTLATCLARGIHYIFPSARMVVDIGAESSTVMKLNESGGVRDWATHDKCASGTGLFLQQIARLMQIPLEEMAKLSLKAKTRADISTTCAVFAESEVISHIHRDPPTPKEEIVAGIYLSVVRRIIALCKRMGIEKDVAVVGGVAANSGLIKILEEELGFKVLVPTEPQIIVALGASLIFEEAANEETG